MSNYRLCLSCESSVAPEIAPVNVVVDGKTIAAICLDCASNVKTCKLVFTRNTAADILTPIQFQCLEAFTAPRNAEIPD